MERMKTVGCALATTFAVLWGVASATADAAVPSATPQATTTGTVTFTSPAPAAVVGGPGYTPTASTNSDQPISFSVDQATTNASCTISDGSVSFEHAGSCVIDAEVPADATYGAASASQTFNVSPAGTATSLVVGVSTLTATVTSAAPGGGTPAGSVLFSVGGRTLGSATLAGGVAALGYSVPPNVTEAILATYQGDADYTGSAVTVTTSGPNIEPTFVAKPTIAARLTSARPKNKQGWWHTAVKVQFVCNGAGSPIIGGCPRPVLLRRSGADLVVTRTIRTAGGDTSTVKLRGIKLDMTSPRVKLIGIREHALYRGRGPHVSCAASDPISGIRLCRVSRTAKRGPTIETVTYTATATSWAGVTHRIRRTIHIKR